MNIISQICGLSVLCVLLIGYFHQKRIGLHSERVFFFVLMTSFLCVLLDMFSLIAIYHREYMPLLLLKFICKSYIVSLVLVGFAALCYIINDIYDEKKFHKMFSKVGILVCVEAAVIYLLPIYFHVDELAVYTYGPSVLLTYVFTLSFIAATIAYILIHRKEINKRRMSMVAIWMGVWFAAAIIQFFNNQILIVGFACSLGMLILYVTLENPENNMDKRVGCFHTHALMEYLKQCYDRKEFKSILLISMAGIQGKNISTKYVNECIIELVHFFENYPSAKVFKNIEQELLVLFPDVSEMNRVFQNMQDTYYADFFYNSDLEEKKKGFPKTLFVLVTDSHIVSTPEELFQVFQYVRLENQHINRTIVCYVNEMILAALKQNEDIKQEIIDAVEEDRVEIFLQPIFSTKDRKFLSAEVLARIRNRDGSIMNPGVFIPMAEESGLIVRIGERIFEKTCSFLKNNRIEDLGLQFVEVNLSVVQCEQMDLADRYIQLMEKYAVKPWWINLEITETSSVQIKNTLLKNMNQLIKYGVTFSLDDFGNGQSNLNYMIDMPVSVMKFDMNMTKAYFENYKAKYVVQSTIRLAHDMEMYVVAEGVETKEQLDEMSKVGVDFIQGYYFSKPLSVHDFLDFIRANQQRPRLLTN